MAVTLDRLKSQLLTSGLQQENFALFQVINQLIDFLRNEVAATDAAISGGGGGGGGGVGLLGATYLTKNKEVLLPNSLQEIAGAGIQFNDAAGRRVVSAAIPFFPDGVGEAEDGPPGPPGIDGKIGVDGAPGMNGIQFIPLDGEDGIDGDPGQAGATGGTGPTGPAGAPGTPGIDGEEGEIGYDGIPGPQGNVGATGATGPQGTSGSTSGPPYIEPEEPPEPIMIPGPRGPSGIEDWDITKIKTSDDTVNNSITFVDDSQLITPLAVSSVYFCEWCIIYSGNNTTGDYKYRFRMGGNQVSIGNWNGITMNPNTALTSVITAVPSANSGNDCYHPSTTGVQAGTDAANSKMNAHGTFMLSTPAAFVGDGNLAFQFALIAAAVGRIVTTYAGSYFRLKKLS